MSPLVWKIHTKTGMKYRVGETEQGEEIYQIDDERSGWVSKAKFERVVESHRALPRDHDRHEPHNIPEYRNFSASAEFTAHLGPLQAPGPRDNRLFPEERHPGEGHTQERYEIRPGDGSTSVETATSRRRESFREPYRGPVNNIDSGATSNLNFQDRSSEGVLEPAAPAPPSHLSALAHIFVGIGLGDYPRSWDFILDNPSILQKSQSDDLMTLASAAEKAGQSTTAKACIHQALLLRECREVGKDGIGSFFRKLTSKDGKEKEAFLRKVGNTYKAIQEQARKTVQQNPDATSESSSRKMPIISQECGQTTSHNTFGYPQTPVGPTQLETPKIREIDGQRYYTDNRGKILRPVSSRRDTDRQRAVSDPAEIIERMAAVRVEGTQGATSLASSRGNSSARDYPLQKVTSAPAPLSIVDEDPQPGPNRPGSNDRSPQKLDERYMVRKDAKKFFVCGRVFAVLWPEPVGNGGGRGSRRGNTLPSGDLVDTGNTMYGEPVFTHIRRMVVVREDHGSCLCLGISTYSRQGVTKYGLNDDDRRAHSIIYMTDQEPYCTPEEQRYLKKKPIAVKPSSADQKLGDMSRLNYKKVYTAEHNYKVMSVGQVTRESLAALLGYWRNTMFPPEKLPYGYT